MRDNVKQSNFLDAHVAELTPSHEQLAYISGDDDDESNSELIPVTSPNLEETIVTSLQGSSDVLSTCTRGNRRRDLYSMKQGLYDQIYLIQRWDFTLGGIPVTAINHQLDLMTMFDSSMRVMLQRREEMPDGVI